MKSANNASSKVAIFKSVLCIDVVCKNHANANIYTSNILISS